MSALDVKRNCSRNCVHVWFLAAWMPLVVDTIWVQNVWWDGLESQQGAVAFADPQEAPSRPHFGC